MLSRAGVGTHDGVPARWRGRIVLAFLTLAMGSAPLGAQTIWQQCGKAGTNEQEGDVTADGAGTVQCMHVAAGDGFVTMADGRSQYIFSFSPIADGTDPRDVMAIGTAAANSPAPTIAVKQGDEVYLTLTNVGMVIRPDLSDPHTIHWHGFPNASSLFDGVPDSSISIGMGSSLTYFYKVQKEGTYLYHCHVEATEHMQMGMYGNLFVHSAQDGQTINGFSKFAYTDGDGSTGYDVEYPILIHGFDPDFHDASESVQPLPFAAMEDRYYMLNGRGYPDTVASAAGGPTNDQSGAPGGHSQPVSSDIQAAAGQRILLRISNLDITGTDTIGTIGIPMLVVGKDARHLRVGTENLYYQTQSLTLGGGETYDVILDTASVGAGTYWLYSTNLHRLSNNEPDYGDFMTGGPMTRIVVN